MANKTAAGGKKRWPWQWIILLSPVALVVMMLAAHRLWLVSEQRKLAGLIARLHARGEPVLPADFAYPPAPYGEDAAPLLREAEVIIDADRTIEWKRLDSKLMPSIPLYPIERETLAACEAELRPAVELASRAAARRVCDLPYALVTPVLISSYGVKYPQRSAANILKYDGLLRFDRGDQSGAFQRAEEILAIGRKTNNAWSLVSHLVSTGVVAVSTDLVRNIAPEIKIGPGQIEPARIRAYIDAMLDDAGPDEGLRQAMRAERMMLIDFLQDVNSAGTLGARGRMTPRSASAAYFERPYYLHNIKPICDTVEACLPAIGSPDLPTALRHVPTKAGGSTMTWWANLITPPYELHFKTQYRARTDRYLTAAALACRWYAVEHNGQLPARLEELVPAYLPAVPIDPMTASGKTIGYRPTGDQPILWSAGDDATDNGGDMTSTRRYEDVGDWDRKDRIVHLATQPRADAEPTKEYLDDVGMFGESPATEPSTQPAAAGDK